MIMADEIKQRYLTPKEVEERYRIKVGTLANWRSQKKGPPYTKVGGIKYPVDEFEKFIEERMVRART